MTLPASIRVNTGAPFPAVIKGTPGISIAKANGIWTIGLSYAQFGIQPAPPVANFSTDYVLVYDSIAQTYFTMPLSYIAGDAQQRSVTTLPVTIQPNDGILHLNLTVPGAITLPLASTRSGVPLMFKDVGMQATANPITISTTAPDMIDGNQSSVTLGVNGQAIRLVPANDGVNTGWWRE